MYNASIRNIFLDFDFCDQGLGIGANIPSIASSSQGSDDGEEDDEGVDVSKIVFSSFAYEDPSQVPICMGWFRVPW